MVLWAFLIVLVPNLCVLVRYFVQKLTEFNLAVHGVVYWNANK